MLSFVNADLSHFDNLDVQFLKKVQPRSRKSGFIKNNIKHVDYMSIDVQGHEMETIQGIDFNAVRINVLTIEKIPDFNRSYGRPYSSGLHEKKADTNYMREY